MKQKGEKKIMKINQSRKKIKRGKGKKECQVGREAEREGWGDLCLPEHKYLMCVIMGSRIVLGICSR
jgi:hypothetical protein